MNPFGDTPVGEGMNPFGDRPISTITGKPIPTGAEKIKQTGEVWKTAGPIAGDIAMTMLAPQFRAGGMGIKAINLLMRSLASGAGSFGGSVAGQKMSGDDIDYSEAKKQGALGLAGEPALTGMGALIKGGGKLAKYGGEYLARPLKPALEKFQKRAIEKEVGTAEKYISDLAPDIVKKQDVPINDLDLKVLKAKDEYGIIYDKYENAIESFAKENDGFIPVDDTAQLLNDMKGDKKAYSFLLNDFGLKKPQIMELKSLLEGGDQLTPKQIKNILATINKNYRAVGPSVQANKEALKEALMGDLSRITGAKDMKAEGDLLFKQVKRFDMVRNLFKPSFGVTKEGKKYIYPYSIAKKIYANEKKLINPKTGVPELWPKLKEMADHYFEIYKPLQKIEATDNFASDKAWGLMPKAVRKILSGLSGIGKKSAKATGKAAIHLGGEEIDF